MVTMNKPASGNTNWHQNLTDNWSAIESSLIDKNLLQAKGDIVAASGASAPVRLPVGYDDQLLTAEASASAGLRWKYPDAIATQDTTDLLWGKKFFSDAGFLPANKIFEYVGTPPGFAGTSGTGVFNSSAGSWWALNNSDVIGWYDLGAAKSKILVVVRSVINTGFSIHLTSSAPTGLNPAGYSVNGTGVDGPSIHRYISSYTRLDAGTGFWNDDYRCGYAFYYDDSTNALKVFLNFGGQWFLAQSATDSTYTTMRYVSLKSYSTGVRFATPFVCYAE